MKDMKLVKINTILLVIGLAVTQTADAADAGNDPLSRMFEWWNGAFGTHGAFTEDAFRDYFTEDSVLIVDGVVSASGIPALAAHFQGIQARSESVRIVLPFEESFTSDNRIFTYHFVYRDRGGEESCMRAMGYAIIEAGKIASIDLVRVPHDPEWSVGSGCGIGD